MKKYEKLLVQLIIFYDDAVRCSNTFSVGDDAVEDDFE